MSKVMDEHYVSAHSVEHPHSLEQESKLTARGDGRWEKCECGPSLPDLTVEDAFAEWHYVHHGDHVNSHLCREGFIDGWESRDSRDKPSDSFDSADAFIAALSD